MSMLNITSTDQPRTPLPPRDRRRHPRRALHDSGRATLMGNGRYDEWSCTGIVLNLSASGIACRIHNTDAGRLKAGRIVRALFRIDAVHEPFDFHARITNATTAGTPGCTIIGMEFLIDADRKRESMRLRSALQNGETTP